MPENNYVVLHRKSQPSFGDPFGADFSFGPTGAGNPSIPEVVVESLDNKAIAQLRKDPTVEAIAPVFPTQLIAPTSGGEVAAYSESGVAWGIQVVKATESPFTGKGVTVAVLDTGIDADHPAFAGVEIIQKDFTEDGNGDRHGHGTHVAGTIFGRTVNGLRFGVAQGVEKALIGKVLGDNGSGSTAGIIRGMQWAYDNGAHVICMSLGMAFPLYTQWLIQQGMPEDLAADMALQGYRANLRLFDRLVPMLLGGGTSTPIRDAMFHSSLVVAAAGNESRRNVHELYEVAVAPPAAADGAISVGALAQKNGSLSVADFSNTGCNISAPGVGIYSALPNGNYASWSGTSMAAPHVAGVAALWAEKLLKERRTINALQLGQLVVGRATQDQLIDNFDPFDVGLGIVQAPLN